MRRGFWIAIAVLSVPALSRAQVADDLRRQGYFFAAPGTFGSGEAVTLEYGGGMQWLVYRGLGLGFDASVLGFAECFPCVGVQFGSLDASYHFVPSSGRLVPFVLGGVGGVAVGDGNARLYSAGGGFNYWFESGRALRVEVRERFDGSGAHLLAVRVGVTF